MSDVKGSHVTQTIRPDVYSYAEVKVTAAAITVTPKDQAGRIVREETGAICRPYTFKAR